ncbi:hypothetical protein Q5752_006123 [Cryptotrichosporon argae]
MIAHRLPTPPVSPPTHQSQPEMAQPVPSLILCADGGGSKVNVVIRSSDGLEVRGQAGPCNVASVGYGPAVARIMTAVHAALAQLPPSHLPASFHLPPSALATPHPSRSPSPEEAVARTDVLPPGLLMYAWLALAGVTTEEDGLGFGEAVRGALGLPADRVKVTNDVILLAAPGITLGVQHIVTVVCGTGTVGRTIRVMPPQVLASSSDEDNACALPLKDVGVARGWGYMLCDEGSAFWIGRLAIRSLLAATDRVVSKAMYSTPAPPPLPLHTELMNYFGVTVPYDLFAIVSLTSPTFAPGLSIGEASAKRNAYMAGAARVVFRWAFDSALLVGATPAEQAAIDKSRAEAMRIVRLSVDSLADLTLEALGDRTVVKPEHSALALGGGLMMASGYRALLEQRLDQHGVRFGQVVIVDDAAGEGARALAALEFGKA